MRTNALVVAALGLLIPASAASAVFTGLTFDGTLTALPVDGSLIAVAQIFATFDDPTDRLLSITAASINCSEPLYQNPFGTDTEPVGALLPVFPDLAFDSFVTMNKESTLDPGPPTALEPGSSFSATGFTGGWFTDGDAPQTTGQLSYLIAQLSVADPAGLSVDYNSTLTIAWKVAGGSAIFTEASIFFHIDIPAPAALALLGIAAVAGGRRRR